jgi:excisionase family DNA binding protein
MTDESMTNNDQIPTAKQQWITTKEAAEISGLSVIHIRYLLRNGRIVGKKLGRDWVTTESAVKVYLATKPKPGRRPKTTT